MHFVMLIHGLGGSALQCVILGVTCSKLADICLENSVNDRQELEKVEWEAI